MKPLKNIINCLFSIRKTLFSVKWYDSILMFKYQLRSRLGYLRGLITCASGKIILDQYNKHPLILGQKTKLVIRPGCSIVLKSDKCWSGLEAFHNNPFFPEATSIGLAPHFLALDPPTIGMTYINLNNGSKMSMGINTVILPGAYISANRNSEISIGNNSYISQDVTINARSCIKIGKNVMLAQQVKIMDFDAHDIFSFSEQKTVLNKSKAVIIEDNVWIGVRATILKGVTIGSGSIVGANSCVTSNVPSNVIVAGNPAKIVKENICWKR